MACGCIDTNDEHSLYPYRSKLSIRLKIEEDSSMKLFAFSRRLDHQLSQRALSPPLRRHSRELERVSQRMTAFDGHELGVVHSKHLLNVSQLFHASLCIYILLNIEGDSKRRNCQHVW